MISQCTAYAVTNANAAVPLIPVPLTVSAKLGLVYSDLVHCLAGGAGASLTLSANSPSPKFYYRTTSASADEISIGGVAKSIVLPVSPITLPFAAGTGFNGIVNSMAVDSEHDYRIYVSEDFTAYHGAAVGHLVRILQDGSLDDTFLPGSGPDDHASTIRLMTDGSGRIYLFGQFTTYDGVASGGIVRILSTGELDPAFNSSPGFDSLAQRGVLLTDGSIRVYACGNFTHYQGQVAPKIARINYDGSLDTSFNLGTGFAVFCSGMALDPTTQSVYVSNFGAPTYNGAAVAILTKLQPSGVVDPAYAGSVGVTNTFLFGVTAAVDNSGAAFALSNFPITIGGIAYPAGIMLVNRDNSRRSSFSPPSGLTAGGGIFDSAPNSDGTIYLVGSFSQFNGLLANSLVRLNADGTNDLTFVTGVGFNQASYLAVPTMDGTSRVYYVGLFSTYQGVVAGRIVRLKQTGDLDQ